MAITQSYAEKTHGFTEKKIIFHHKNQRYQRSIKTINER